MDDIRKILERKPDIGIILIEHDMSIIEKIADRVVVINYGQKIAEGSYVNICEMHEVLEAYLGKTEC
jgi:ABC-type branched-subunit amino acid transport system ATPase component